MMKEAEQKLTLDLPAAYQIRVPGEIDVSWADWAGGMAVTVDSEGDGSPVSILTGSLDQASLRGPLRRLYSRGLPLISVGWVECAADQDYGP